MRHRFSAERTTERPVSWSALRASRARRPMSAVQRWRDALPQYSSRCTSHSAYPSIRTHTFSRSVSRCAEVVLFVVSFQRASSEAIGSRLSASDESNGQGGITGQSGVGRQCSCIDSRSAWLQGDVCGATRHEPMDLSRVHRHRRLRRISIEVFATSL